MGTGGALYGKVACKWVPYAKAKLTEIPAAGNIR
jgi:hypothetical protein